MRQHILAFSIITLMTGCGGNGTNDQTATRGQAAAGGAVVGALLGQVFGKDTKSTIVGGIVGAGLGLAAGEVVAQRKANYASRESLIDGETALAEQTAAETEAYNRQLRQDIASLDRGIAEHQAAIASGNADRDRATALKREAQQKLQTADARLANVEEELQVSRDLHADASAGAATRGLDEWQQTIEDLEEERAELTALIDDLKTSSQRI